MTQEEVYALIEAHYRANAQRIVKSLGHMLGNFFQAEDTVQECYARACQYWDSYDPVHPIGKWFNGIMGNCIKDTVAIERHHGMVDELNAIDEQVSPEAINRVLLTQVQAMIEQQEEAVKKILKLYFFDQYSVLDIIRATGTPRRTIFHLVSSFRKMLRTQFKGQLFER